MTTITAPVTVPDELEHEGSRYRVTRAWPHRRGLAVELRRHGPDRAGNDHGAPTGPIHAGLLHRGGDVEVYPHGEDPGLPALAGVTGRLLSHRAGRRAVLDDGERFVKVVRPGTAGRVLDGAGRAAPLGSGYLLPRHRILGDGVVAIERVPGRPLISTAHDAESWARAWQLWESADAAVADAPGASPADASGAAPRGGQGARPAEPPATTVHDVAAEVAVLDGWAARIRTTLGTDLAAEAAVTAVTERLRAGADDDGPAVPAHRDLHDGQLLVSARAVALIDLDTACHAPAGLDLGNLLAHMTMHRTTGLLSDDGHARAAAAIRRRAEARGVGARRLAEWERAALARLGLVFAVRPGSQRLAARLRRLSREGATA
ncbi:phosphotransferase [Mycetocola reblochoni]|uniref:Aminoglycoside phosphotransferase domain-containing protein n=2 Tax=Mycetocola reblochoni TaxID=331618 RepID=A0A1R4K8W5_9MICO|nr:phosphotransferase [Mycetocola reblochoni]RLP68083.1 hypothetical protein D9V30_11285 [Mycetocola reblochoni]SJN40634.1 hypothetical protein FM119_12100 [Mycetocola reblochoni REB411]